MRTIYFSLVIAMIFSYSCSDHQIDARFQKKVYTSSSGKIMPYRFFIPNYDTSVCKYPIIIFLHRGTGSGTNNINQVSGNNWQGSHLWIHDKVQNMNPSFVIAPQLPEFYRWNNPSDTLSTFLRYTMELIDSVINSYPIDINRIYITGQSLGGWGVWDAIIKRSDFFAAAIPVCGGGNSDLVFNQKNVSIWAFHGRLDHIVSVKRSKEMVDSFRAIGANVKYTEYVLSGHEIWGKVYDDKLINWLYLNSKE